MPFGTFSSVSKRRVAEVAEDGPVIGVGALLGDHVDGGAFGAAVLGREALRADLEFLHGFQGKLHDRSADGVVLVVDAVDGDVDVAAAGAVDGENGVAVLGGIVRVGGLYAGGEISQIGHVAADHGQLFHLGRA